MFICSTSRELPDGMPSPGSSPGERPQGRPLSALLRAVPTCLLALAGILGYAVEGRTQTLADDRAALVDLYNATAGPSWTNNTNWLDNNQPLDMWHGVTVSNGRVTRLSLSSNRLTGSMPQQLGNLDKLERLVLSNNQLTGTIPAELGMLTNLQTLYLDNNQLTGTLPPSFTGLAALDIFHFHLNPGLCAQVAVAIRTWLGGISEVRGPDCSPAVLLSVTPSSLFEDSGATPVTVTATRQAVNTSTTVDLRRGGSAQEGVGLDYTVSGTESITIPANATSGTTLLTFTPLADGVAEDDENIILEAVVGTKTEGSVTLPLIDEARACAARDRMGLEALYNATGGPNWTNNTNWLDKNQPLSNWHGVMVDGNGCVTNLQLSNNQLTGAIPSQLGNLANLTEVSLGSNQLTGSVPPTLGNLANLEILSLSDNQLTGTIPSQLGNLVNLERLIFENNQLTGAIPTWLASLANLGNLNLSDNQLTGAIPTELGSLASLWRLSLHGNQLTGSIPAELGNLANLRTLGIFDNQLTGAIPPQLGNLANLEKLVLSSNQLTGPIPSQLANLANLESLVLSNNQLTGAIPAQLGNLANLEWLYVDNNQLTGTLPPSFTGLVALKFFRFYLNPGLCAQDSGAIRTWLNGVSNVRGPDCSPAVLLSVTHTSLFEGAGATPVTVTATRQAVNTSTTVNLRRGGSAQEGVGLDYTVSGTESITIPANATSGTTVLTFTPLADGLAEGDENIILEAVVGTKTEGSVTLPLVDGASSCAARDRAALEALYNATGGPNWTNNTNWLDKNQPLTNWHGVTVDGNGCVTELRLPANQLTGSIPSQLGNLDNLQILDLSNNQLTGTLPASFTGLVALKFFHFHLNPGLCAQTDAAIRAWLNGVSDVRGPDCSPAVLLSVTPSSLFEGAGATPVTVTATRQAVNTSTTVNLRRGGSAQEGAGLDYTVSGTESITIPANATSGTTVLTFTPLADGLAEGDENIILEAVVGTKTEGSVTLPLVDGASSCAARDRAALEALYNATGGPNWTNNTNWLDKNQPLSNWHGVMVDGNGCVTNLQLSNNQLTGAIPSQLGNLGSLQYLDLSNNQLTGTLPASFTGLVALKFFHFHLNPGLCAQTDAAIRAWLNGVSDVRGPDCSPAVLLSVTPSSLFEGAGATTVTVTATRQAVNTPTTVALRRGGSAQEGVGLDYTVSGTESITIPANATSGTTVLTFTPLADGLAESDENIILEAVVGTKTEGSVTLPLIDEARACAARDRMGLEALYNATGGPNWTNNTNWLDKNQPLSNWHGVMVDGNGCVTNLQLSNNQLTGAIPSQLGNLTKLVDLQLFDNQLTGDIPPELGNLALLEQLLLHNNHLTGSIPPSFTNLGALEFFSFYGNTNLIVPDDPALQAWLDGITNVQGPGDITPKPTSAHFVPVILTASGRNNSFFTSELTLTNRGSQTAPLQYTYTAAAGGGSGQASETLAPGRQKIVPNAIDYLRTLGVPIPGSGNRIGTLRVAVSGSDVGVTARTTTRVADGRAGLAYPGIAVADGFTEAVYLCGLRQNVQDRSNVAFQNMGTSQEGSITLRTTVFSGDANAPGSQALPDVTLAPGGFHQYSGLLATAGIAQGYVKVERVSGGAPFYAYGVINDQANSDGSFVFPVTASSLAGVRGQTLPVIIEHPNFSSELIVTNFSNSTKEFSFHFVADAITTPDKTVSSAGDRMASGAQWIIPNFVQAMRAGGFEGIGPRGRTIAGAAFFEAVSGDLSGVVIGARTGSPGGGGQYSVFYNAVPYGAAFRDTAWVYALQQNAENRSNLALVNTGEVDGGDSVFELEIYDGNTGQQVNTVTGIRVPARGWHQINLILGSYAPGTTQGYVRIRKTAGSNPFLAYGVVNDGGAPGQRSGDGAYLPAAGD